MSDLAASLAGAAQEASNAQAGLQLGIAALKEANDQQKQASEGVLMLINTATLPSSNATGNNVDIQV